MRKNFKYSARFKSVANIVTPKEEDQYKAKASLDSLGKLLNISQDKIDDSPDLLYVSADLFVGGMANLNDHAITKEDAVALASQIEHKYINLEHKEDQIVGALLDYGFREYADDRKFIEKDKAADHKSPIVVAAAGFIWRSLHPNLADLLVKASDKDDDDYGKASFSWEILFKDFDVLEGSKFIDEGTVISDPEEVKKRKSHLKQFGGTGSYKGQRIYTLVKGPKLLLGAGIVRSPAADVEGIFTAETETNKADASINENAIIETKGSCDLDDGVYDAKRFCSYIEIEGQKYETKSKNRCGNGYNQMKVSVASGKVYWKEYSGKDAPEKVKASKKRNKSSKKISQTNKNNVNKIKAMKIKNLEDYETVLASISDGDEVDNKTIAELQANFKPIFDKAVASQISDAITEASEKFSAEKAELEGAADKAAVEKEKLEAKISELEDGKASTDQKLKEVEDRLDQEAQARSFNERMEALTEEYDFENEPELKKLVANKIKDLDEEAYASYVEELKILAGDKTKVVKAAKAKELEEAEAKKVEGSNDETPEEIEAREKEEATKAIAAAKAEAKEKIPNSKTPEKTSFADNFEGLKLILK